MKADRLDFKPCLQQQLSPCPDIIAKLLKIQNRRHLQHPPILHIHFSLTHISSCRATFLQERGHNSSRFHCTRYPARHALLIQFLHCMVCAVIIIHKLWSRYRYSMPSFCIEVSAAFLATSQLTS